MGWGLDEDESLDDVVYAAAASPSSSLDGDGGSDQASSNAWALSCRGALRSMSAVYDFPKGR